LQFILKHFHYLSGDVVTQDCVDNIIKKDWLHPLTAEPITEDDIIPLQRGGTGYAAANKEQLKANLARPVMQLQ
jgi:nitric oxide synthase-interacting protein